MRVGATAVLAAIFLVLGGGYYLYDVRGREAREAAQAAERRVLHFELAEVRQITIEKRGERLVVRGGADGWRVVAPEDAAADAATVDGLLAFVRRLEKVRAVEGSPSDLKEFGLDAPLVRLRLDFRGGDAVTLLLAGPNPVATGVYAKIEESPTIFLAPDRLARELGKTPYLDELRDRTILPLDPDRVRRFEIARADARIVVERSDGRRWQVERPFRGPGDDGIIRDLLWKIGSSRAHAVIGRPGPPGDYGLDRPHARLVVIDDRGAARTLTVAQAASSGALYAQVGDIPTVHVTDGQLLTDLAIAPDLLRNRQLLVYDQRQIQRITIRYPTTSLVLERAGEAWRMREPVEGEAVRATVENILEVLPNLRYTSIEGEPRRDLGYYGLDRPRLAITVGQEGGQELPTLAVGREESGQHFVIVGGKAPVYRVDARLIRVIPADPSDAKRYPLPEQLKRGWQKIHRDRN